MSNPAKRKGTAWESAIRDFLKVDPRLRHARRAAQEGRLDVGDLHVWPFVLQAKAVKAFDLSGWVTAAELQAKRACFPYGVAVVKAPGKATGRGYVVMSLETFRYLAADLGTEGIYHNEDQEGVTP